MEEISRALKKGKSSIYYYFSSKEEIFEAVVLYEANQLRTQLTTAIKSVESPPDSFVTIFMSDEGFCQALKLL